MAEGSDIGHDEPALQGQQLGTVQARQFVEHFLAFFQHANFNVPPVLGRPAALDQTLFFAARNQRDHAVVLGLHALRKLSDRRPIAAGVALDLQQQQVLQRLDAVLPRELFAEADEFPDLVAKICERFEVLLFQRTGVRSGHGVAIGR